MAQFERVVLPQPDPACPAADPVAEAKGGTGCRCRIEDRVIEARFDPSTLRNFCYNRRGYVNCSTWRREKDYIARERTNRDYLDPVTGDPRVAEVP